MICTFSKGIPLAKSSVYKLCGKNMQITWQNMMRMHRRFEAAQCGDMIREAKVLYSKECCLYQSAKLQCITSSTGDDADRLKFVTERLMM